MPRVLLPVILATLFAADVHAQVVVDLLYGVARNVESAGSELDGRLSGSVEWIFPSGVGLGLGTDHQFEGAAISPSEHQGFAIYFSTSYQVTAGAFAPFIRGGIGLGRAPCEGDTCSDGADVRGSAGLRVWVVEKLGISGELGVSRVSRPFGGAGISYRF